jgi:chemotaxis protein methyltransferase CheR
MTTPDLAQADFTFIRDVLRRETAIVLENGKEYLVCSRLIPLVRAAHLQSLEELIALLRNDTNHCMWRSVIDALTTNETSFFRDLEPYDILKKIVIPKLLDRRGTTHTLRIWSAACSSGQEPYSLAMLLHDSFPELQRWDVKIYATDISTEILERAKAGVFFQHEVNRGLPALYLVKYFEKHGSKWHIKDVLKERISFNLLNLNKGFTLPFPMDIILLRNVLIYFDVETKKEIFARIKEYLAPDGYLFLGSAETTLGIDNAFTRIPENKGSCFHFGGQ